MLNGRVAIIITFVILSSSRNVVLLIWGFFKHVLSVYL